MFLISGIIIFSSRSSGKIWQLPIASFRLAKEKRYPRLHVVQAHCVYQSWDAVSLVHWQAKFIRWTLARAFPRSYVYVSGEYTLGASADWSLSWVTCIKISISMPWRSARVCDYYSGNIAPPSVYIRAGFIRSLIYVARVIFLLSLFQINYFSYGDPWQAANRPVCPVCV